MEINKTEKVITYCRRKDCIVICEYEGKFISSVAIKKNDLLIAEKEFRLGFYTFEEVDKAIDEWNSSDFQLNENSIIEIFGADNYRLMNW